MAENKLEFIPVTEQTIEQYIPVFCETMLPKAQQEFELIAKPGEQIQDTIVNAVKMLQDAFFVMFGSNVLAIAGRRKIEQDGVVLSFLLVSTTSFIKKYFKQFYIASKKFIQQVENDSDIIIFSVPEDYDRSRAIARRLGFTKISVDDYKGCKIVTKILRCNNGVDR